MKSIDNLREYALTAASVNATTRAVLAGYVDEIEREVEELRDRDYRNGREDAKGAVEFADRLCRASERREDVTLWGVDYTPLPVDADGVPIHVGDVMEWCDSGETLAVHGIGYDILFYIDGENAEWTAARNKRHHHAPTVEDVLREFTRDWCNAACAGDMTNAERDAARADTITEYAAKLRLAGEE